METDDPISRIQATAERAFAHTLDGGCSSPIAAYAQVSGQEVLLTGLTITIRKGSILPEPRPTGLKMPRSWAKTLARKN